MALQSPGATKRWRQGAANAPGSGCLRAFHDHLAHGRFFIGEIRAGDGAKGGGRDQGFPGRVLEGVWAFLAEHEAALEILARQAAATLALCEMGTSESAPAIAGAAAGLTSREHDIQVVHHGFDDSIFIDNNYVIKGVAGRLLAFMLERFIEEGRCDFTNREIRLSDGLRLPDVKDNLETRLLLQRGLEEKAFPVRLTRSGRGRIRLSVSGRPVLKNAD